MAATTCIGGGGRQVDSRHEQGDDPGDDIDRMTASEPDARYRLALWNSAKFIENGACPETGNADVPGRKRSLIPQKAEIASIIGDRARNRQKIRPRGGNAQLKRQRIPARRPAEDDRDIKKQLERAHGSLVMIGLKVSPSLPTCRCGPSLGIDIENTSIAADAIAVAFYLLRVIDIQPPYCDSDLGDCRVAAARRQSLHQRHPAPEPQSSPSRPCRGDCCGTGTARWRLCQWRHARRVRLSLVTAIKVGTGAILVSHHRNLPFHIEGNDDGGIGKNGDAAAVGFGIKTAGNDIHVTHCRRKYCLDLVTVNLIDFCPVSRRPISVSDFSKPKASCGAHELRHSASCLRLGGRRTGVVALAKRRTHASSSAVTRLAIAASHPSMPKRHAPAHPIRPKMFRLHVMRAFIKAGYATISGTGSPARSASSRPRQVNDD